MRKPIDYQAKFDSFSGRTLYEKLPASEQELVRRFAEASNEEAGEHFTPREIIKLMVELLINSGAKYKAQDKRR